MKIGYMLGSEIYNKTDLASSRIRGDWLIKYWPDAERFVPGQKYDAVIFQKVYYQEYADSFKGIKILDMCDPDWLDVSHFKQMVDAVDAVVCSTYKLADFIKKLTDKMVVVIPDRQDLEYFKEKKIHKGRAKNVVWYGYAHNSYVLKQTLPYLQQLGLGVIIISNEFISLTASSPYANTIQETWKKWTLDTVNKNIIKGDIVLLPEPFLEKDKYKSNNKTTNAWALGMPVAKNFYDLKRFMEEDERKKESEVRLQEVKDKWDVKKSVFEIETLINKLYVNRI